MKTTKAPPREQLEKLLKHFAASYDRSSDLYGLIGVLFAAGPVSDSERLKIAEGLLGAGRKAESIARTLRERIPDMLDEITPEPGASVPAKPLPGASDKTIRRCSCCGDKLDHEQTTCATCDRRES